MQLLNLVQYIGRGAQVFRMKLEELRFCPLQLLNLNHKVLIDTDLG